MARSRKTAKDYGSETQELVTGWYKRIWQYATAAGSGRPGRDILNVPVSIEVKGRADFQPLRWIREARKDDRQHPEDEFPPWAVMRCIGQGEASVGQFIVLQSLEDHTAMVRELILLRQLVKDHAIGDQPGCPLAVSLEARHADEA